MVRALCSTLIGRERELSDLEDALLGARRGRGGVVILGGEAGMGKTRLATELVRRARSLGVVVMSGGCTEAEVSLPYLPFLEAIGNHLASADVPTLTARLGSAAVDLAQLFPQLGASGPAGGDPVHSKLRLFEAMLVLLTQAAGEGGLLLLLEDLHWADPATRELLDYLTRRLRSTNVLTVATYRSEELHRKHALLPTIQGWRRAGTVELVELQPLGEGSVCDMLCSIFDQATVSDEFVSFLRERTEGNPFVIEEMLKEAIDRGDVFRTAEGWDRKDIRELRVPPTVRDGILLRLERLPEQDVRVLSAASVVGRSFDAGVIAAAAQLDAEAAVESLQRCVQHQLVDEDEDAPGSYHFRHALTREAIYEDMVTPRRQQLHSRVADVLAEKGRPAVELAHHLLLARRDAESVEVCRRAAEEAATGLAYVDAAQLLERAAPLASDPAERGRLLCQAGTARWNNQETGPARRALEEGIALLDGAGADLEAAAARTLLGRCFWELQRTDDAAREYQSARSVLAAHGPSEALATVYVRLAGIEMFNYRYQEAYELAARAEEIAREAGAEKALASAWIFMSGPLQHRGELERGAELMERAYLLAVDRGFWFQAGNATFNSIWTGIHYGLGREAGRWWERANREIPAHVMDTWISYGAALCDIYRGDLEKALAGAAQSAERSEEGGNRKQQWRAQVLQAQALAELDRGEEAAAVLPALASRTDRQDVIYDGAARIRTALARRDVAGARELAAGVDVTGAGVASPLDAAVLLLHDRPDHLAELEAALSRGPEVDDLPRHLAVRGAARLAAGDTAGARELLERSVARSREEGLLLDAWHTSLNLARARAAAGDTGAAAELLESVVGEAAAHSAALVARLARELAAELGLTLREPAPPAPAPAEPASSEPRQAGERLVSVLFADIRNFTATTAGSAPAELADRIAAFQRWAVDAVQDHHGVIDKFAGDAVMATFNIGGSSLDHAAHAVLCARELVDKAAAAGLPVGAGVATGPAVVGRLAEGANLSVLGVATNLAARLQAVSAAGELTVSLEAHRRLPQELRQGAERVELELKGFEEPVVAYRLAKAAASGAPPQPPGAAGTAPGGV